MGETDAPATPSPAASAVPATVPAATPKSPTAVASETPSAEARQAGPTQSSAPAPSAIPERTVIQTPRATAPGRVRVDTRRGGQTNDYRIGEEDELAINVYGEAELAKTQAVRPGGKISFPLIGDVDAKGLTPGELGREITRRLGPYVKNPQVTVVVTKYSSKKVSVLGR